MQCHHLVEDNEEKLEEYWFKVWAKNKDADLLKWFCIEKIKGKTEVKKMVLWMSFLMIINAQVKNTKFKFSFDKIEEKNT